MLRHLPIFTMGVFVNAKENATEQEFCQQILQKFTDHKALDFMFEQVKKVALQGKEE